MRFGFETLVISFGFVVPPLFQIPAVNQLNTVHFQLLTYIKLSLKHGIMESFEPMEILNPAYNYQSCAHSSNLDK